MACETEIETEPETRTKLDFQSLKADKETLVAGETTGVKATATGYELTYSWSASSGVIHGSGSRVTFESVAGNCGGSRVTCQVKDGHDAYDSKTIVILVE